MRTLITSFVASVALFITGSFAQAKAAADAPLSDRRISVVRTFKYGQQTSVLELNKHKWICQTELSDRVPIITAQPRSLKAVAAVVATKKIMLSQQSCKDQLFVSDTSVSNEKVFAICATEPAAAKLIDILGLECGRHY